MWYRPMWHTVLRLTRERESASCGADLRMNSARPGRRMTLISCTSPSISTGTLKNDTPESGRTAWRREGVRGLTRTSRGKAQ